MVGCVSFEKRSVAWVQPYDRHTVIGTPYQLQCDFSEEYVDFLNQPLQQGDVITFFEKQQVGTRRGYDVDASSGKSKRAFEVQGINGSFPTELSEHWHEARVTLIIPATKPKSSLFMKEGDRFIVDRYQEGGDMGEGYSVLKVKSTKSGQEYSLSCNQSKCTNALSLIHI